MSTVGQILNDVAVTYQLESEILSQLTDKNLDIRHIDGATVFLGNFKKWEDAFKVKTESFRDATFKYSYWNGDAMQLTLCYNVPANIPFDVNFYILDWSDVPNLYLPKD